MPPSPTPGAALPPVDAMTHDAVRAMQQIYRVLLDAMAHPGLVYQLITHPQISIDESTAHPAVASVLLTLADHEVSLHIDGGDDALEQLLVRRLRVSIVPATEADFVVTRLATLDPTLLRRVKRGSLEYPEDGATVIIVCDALTAADGSRLTLRGPGIREALSVRLPGLSELVLRARAEAVSGYPPGIDILLVDDAGRVIGLPRTTRMEWEAN